MLQSQNSISIKCQAFSKGKNIMLIWNGLGFLVAVIVFGISLAANAIFNSLYGAKYYEQHKWPFAISLAISGVLCGLLGHILRKRSDVVMIEKHTGKEVVVNRSKHTLFFIPMHWWAPILIVAAAIVAAIDLWR
jgi:hypothetical protein